MASGAKSTFDDRRDNPAPSKEHRSFEEDLIRIGIPENTQCKPFRFSELSWSEPVELDAAVAALG